jgi:hypothetical protein
MWDVRVKRAEQNLLGLKISKIALTLSSKSVHTVHAH